VLVEDPDIERRVIGLPDLVGAAGFATMQQVEALRVGAGPFLCQRDQCWIELPNHTVDLPVAWLDPAALPRDRSHLPLNRRR
jgi:hypothetical protein